MPVFQSPNICRDLSDTPEFKVLANLIRDDFGHKMIEVKKSLHEQKKILTGFRVSPTYKNMLSLFFPDVVALSIKAGESMKIYGLPVIEDEEVSCIQFEYREKKDIEDSIENSDIVITINSKDGKLISPQMRVYAKNGDELRQIGLIQNISVNASVEKLEAEMCVGFPLEKEGMSDTVKDSLKEYSSLLAEKGCLIKLSDNQE
jgi:hypothetical protein